MIALRATGASAEVLDSESRWVYATDDLRLQYGGLLELAAVPVGEHYFGPEAMGARRQWRGGPTTIELGREVFASIGGWMLSATEGGHDALRSMVDPTLRDMVDDLSPNDPGDVWTFVGRSTFFKGALVDYRVLAFAVRDEMGRRAGTVFVYMPAVGMAVVGSLALGGDLRHFERMRMVARPARRPAAILFADLEASSPLARRMSTASYFALGRRLVRTADQCIVDAGGLVGRHAGDGVVAFFLAETAGSESSAARACVEAARALRDAVASVGARSELQDDEIVLRFGLHWGANLYVGQTLTSGRAEVTALGDAANEAARIEACATGGRALASKDLIERLAPSDARTLGLDPDHIAYTPLGDLATATEKARRDAPAIAVCEV